MCAVLIEVYNVPVQHIINTIKTLNLEIQAIGLPDLLVRATLCPWVLETHCFLRIDYLIMFELQTNTLDCTRLYREIICNHVTRDFLRSN